MAQDISIEDAFPTFQRRVRELFDENLVLRAQVDVLERRLAELQQGAAEPAPVLPGQDPAAQSPAEAIGQAPPPAGPDLAALPPLPDRQRR